MSEPTRRVVYVITTTGIGGAERQVYELASTFRSRGWEVGVVSLIRLSDHFLPLLDAGVQLSSLEMAKGVPDPRALARLARILRRWQPDVVHAHMVHANLLARLSRPLASVPKLITTMHNQDEGPQWRYYVYRLTDRLSDVTTAVSRLAVDEAARRHAVPTDKIHLIPNGLSSEHFRPDPELRESTRRALGLGDEFIWLSVGRLTEAKRHADLIAALRIAREAVPHVRVLIAGTGPLEADLRARIDDSGLATNVELMGQRDDVRALMQAADGFVMSSAWEGLPMVLLEASASALPIVATDVGGSRDIISDGATGLLTQAREPEQLARAMLDIMALSAQDRGAMGDRARQRVIERFDMEHVADEWEALYRAGEPA